MRLAAPRKGAAWRSAPIGSLALTMAVAVTLACQTCGAAWAMDLKVAGNQLSLSGPVIGDELGRVEKTLDDDRAIDTVILRNSPGGDAPTGYRVGEMFRARGLRTAISGYCYSSCSRMFLGGASRHFTDDFPPEYTDVGFHGHYDGHGYLVVKLVQDLGLKDWIIKYSDGKADPAGRTLDQYSAGHRDDPFSSSRSAQARRSVDLHVSGQRADGPIGGGEKEISP